MANKVNPRAVLDPARYAVMQTRWRDLAKRLPDGAAWSLADEVIRRVGDAGAVTARPPPDAALLERLCLALLYAEDDVGGGFCQCLAG